MPDITPSKSINIETELANLALYKYHPNGIVNVSLNRVQDMLDGKVEVVDPSNPFVYLLETSSLNAAFAIQEATLLTRKLYPRLANNEDDLYLHMSDVDYLGRFAEPSFAYININILFSDFKTKARYDPVQKEHILTLPRHLKITVDKYIFTLQAGIVIRLTESGVIDVKFENQEYANIFPIETNYINFNLTSINQEETYLNFKIKMPEVDVEPVEIPVEKSKLFTGTMTYHPDRNFYLFRCFHMLDGVWEEMIVTHTEQVYDVYTPTCSVKVNQITKEVEYYIPPVYVNTGRLGSKVKFLIYTTMGPINVNFNDYKISDFTNEYNPVFPEVELNDNTAPLYLITRVIYIADKVVDGKGPINFEDLKMAVIDNSIGDRKLPITNKQLEYNGNQNNFRIIRDVDIVTNRIFLLECGVPASGGRYSVGKFNMDLMEFKTNVTDLVTGKNSVIKINNDITILPEGTVFEITENSLRIIDEIEHVSLKSLSDIELTSTVNSKRFVSLYYHYVLDTSGDTASLRAYDINAPVVDGVNFKGFNATARIGINTTNTNLVKTENGFSMDVLANLKRYNETLNETNITPYIVFKDVNDSLFFLEGRLYTTITDNPVYRFDMLSEYYVDANNNIVINNFKDSNGSYIQVGVPLDSKLELIYVTNSIPLKFEASSLDQYIYGSYIAVDKAVVTLETLSVRFGYYLEHLYCRVHSSTGKDTYQTYAEDVILRYEHTVYGQDNSVLHTVGETVYAEDGVTPIYKHFKGDVILDENDVPLPLSELELERYLNLLFIDYRVTLTHKPLIKDYKKYLRSYLTEMITENAKNLQDELIENSVGYLVVPKNLDNVKVTHSGKISYIKSTQSFKINVYVTGRVYDDADARLGIEESVRVEVDAYLYENNKLSKTVLLNKLYGKLSEFIKGISIDKFTELDEEYMEINDEWSRIGINKLLVTEVDGYNLKDDIAINFIKTTE